MSDQAKSVVSKVLGLVAELRAMKNGGDSIDERRADLAVECAIHKLLDVADVCKTR